MQEYFGLYVNLPNANEEEDIHNSIQNAIHDYMRADERELTCDKCGHDRVSVITTFHTLPR